MESNEHLISSINFQLLKDKKPSGFKLVDNA